MTTPTPCSAAWRRRVAAYHDGGVVGSERNAVETHIRECATCQEAVRSYDQTYRALRALPGFEGVLTITRPGTRRGLGSAQRPSLTYPGRNHAGNDYPNSMRPAYGGSISVMVSLLLILGIIFLVGRDDGLFGPFAQPAPATAPVSTVAPTYGATVPGGKVCANQQANSFEPYIYTDASQTMWEVVGCNAPIRYTTLPAADADVGLWSPDDSDVMAFTPSLPQRTTSTITRLYILSYGHDPQLLDVRLKSTEPLLTVDDAVWVNTTTIIVRSHRDVYQIDLTTLAITVLPFKATRIEWRNDAIFYSTIANGQATLRRYDPTTGSDTKVLSLGAGQDSCQTWRCWSNAPWDVSNDGLWVAHQYPLPQSIPTAQATTTTLVLENLASSMREAAGTMPVSDAPIGLYISPDDHFIAASPLDATQTSMPTTIDNLLGLPQFTVAKTGRLVWRPDSGALIISPFGVASSSRAVEVFVDTNATIVLPAGTGNYDWQV
jgi:hypothetical protein